MNSIDPKYGRRNLLKRTGQEIAAVSMLGVSPSLSVAHALDLLSVR